MFPIKVFITIVGKSIKHSFGKVTVHLYVKRKRNDKWANSQGQQMWNKKKNKKHVYAKQLFALHLNTSGV